MQESILFKGKLRSGRHKERKLHLRPDPLVVNGFPELIVGDVGSGRHKDGQLHLRPEILMITYLLAQVEEGLAAVTQSEAKYVD